MKDYEVLAERFDMVDAADDMPVSEEDLGAYLEGNIDTETASIIDAHIFADPVFADFTEDITMDFDPEIYVHDVDMITADALDSESMDVMEGVYDPAHDVHFAFVDEGPTVDSVLSGYTDDSLPAIDDNIASYPDSDMTYDDSSDILS